VDLKRRIWLLFLLLMVLSSAGECILAQDFYSRDIIDTPTAGLLPRGSYTIAIRAYPMGGVLGQIGIGLMERFEMGVSFGGSNVIGRGNVEWNPDLEFACRYRLLDETVATPALALGFDSQGWGEYIKEEKRYEIKSRGFYGVLSKNYDLLGQLGLNLGANVSLEGRASDDNNPSLFCGVIKGLNSDFYLVAEYDLPLSTGSVAKDLDSGEGFFNAGVRFLFDQSLLIEVDLRDINGNARDSDRTLRIAYQNSF